MAKMGSIIRLVLTLAQYFPDRTMTYRLDGLINLTGVLVVFSIIADNCQHCANSTVATYTIDFNMPQHVDRLALPLRMGAMSELRATFLYVAN